MAKLKSEPYVVKEYEAERKVWTRKLMIAESQYEIIKCVEELNRCDAALARIRCHMRKGAAFRRLFRMINKGILPASKIA